MKHRFRINAALLGPTMVLAVVALLFSGILPFSLLSRSERKDERDVRRLLVLRSEQSSLTHASVDNIWELRTDGADLRRITDEPYGILEYAIAPDGARIVYIAPDGPLATAIWVVDRDGTTRARLSPSTEPALYASPAWSPAGDAILYVRRNLDAQRGATPSAGAGAASGVAVAGAPKIYAITPDGKQLGRVYGNGEEIGEAPVWSPDASRVAFREVFAQQGLTNLVILAFASAPIRVATGINTRIAWSPDGKWIAYDEGVTNRNGESRIVLVRADGVGRSPLFPGEEQQDVAPAWSPDGQTLAFLRRASGPPPANAVAVVREVWHATKDGRNLRRLFGGDGRASSEPIWSPDGQMVASTRYAVSGTAERGVWLVNADGSRARQLLKNASSPIWLP